MRKSSSVALLAGLLMVAGLAAPVSAAGSTYYVDGKLGNDTNNGLTVGAPFKTIARASMAVPAGSAGAGSTVIVKGYVDYVYRERPIPSGWGRTGTQQLPIVFKASGYVAGSASYVRPIVSGADVAPAQGNRWTASTTAGVWYTPWATPPADFGKNAGSTLPTTLFQDTRTWLWEQASLSALGTRAAAGKGGYWYDATAKRLYVSAVSTTGSVQGTDPSTHVIEVIMRSGFFIDGRYGGDYIQVRGFEVRHSANGIAYLYGADFGTVADNVVLGNLYMGISVSGYQTATGPDPADGMTIWRNRGSLNTIEMIKITTGATNASICYNDASQNGLAGILVGGPIAGSTYTGQTKGITLCSNQLHDNNFTPTGTTPSNAAGVLISSGAQNVTVKDNQIWGNNVGIHFTQTASNMPAMNGISITRNRIWSNVRFGIYFFDGYRGSGAGKMVASYDLIWGNGTGIYVDRGSTNKTLLHETIHGNAVDGVKVGGYQVAPASVTIDQSLITSNAEYGIWLVTGNTAKVTYTGISGNKKGNIVGSLTATAVNANAAGYRTTTVSSTDFLRIATTSYQFTAGPSSGPIGAKY